MIDAVAEPGDRLARRLARFRTANPGPGTPDDPLPYRPRASLELARRLAAAVDGKVVEADAGVHVRVEAAGIDLPVDRRRLASLPGQAPADRPLVCLDTETTGLATAAGTVAFLIGLGWWTGETFRQVQLLLPDQGEEGVLLDQVARHIPPDAWLVTYNGRGFDWPLLVTRFRMARRAAPDHAGHLDLLPLVRRLFRHRMVDARLGTVERTLLGVVRHDDVDGWEIPGRYLGFLRGGPAQPLAAVVRHNGEDVRSLGRLLQHIERGLGDPIARTSAPRGDLAGLARAFRRERRFDEAVDCLDAALAADPAQPQPGPSAAPATRVTEEPWWSPRRRADFGGRPQRRSTGRGWDRRQAFARPWDEERIAVDRAHLLRRMGRIEDALTAWDSLACGPGRVAVLAAIEGAKLREHRLRDPDAAMATVERGFALADRRRARGLPEPALEADLRHRWRRLRLRVADRQSASSAARTGPARASSVGRSNGAGQSNIAALRPASR
ncbi:MAG TPA: ribonuclease H-like domain-containing protein [Candidatus Limnocylindrales bacterium]|nr:ribonuclease H-like domain-containing protein [Candidatus Limnocylindrales bacterium]